jgi:hypothetical protein
MKLSRRGCWAVNHFGNWKSFALVAVLVITAGAPTLASPGLADSFDAPLKKKVVDFGLSPSNVPGSQTIRVKLSCYFYATFLVKEYDTGEKGAEWLAIVPTKKEVAPACTRSHQQGERIIEGTEWSGYFKGAKGHLVFFRGDDGYNGGLPFAIYDSETGTKVFEDSVILDSHFNQIRFNSTHGGKVSLRYMRVVQADCDLHKEKATCWDSVRKKFDLKNAQMPVCTGYKGIIGTDPGSAIAYHVEVFLSPQAAIKTTNGPAKCWPVD